MGKAWDGWSNPASFQRWCHAWASAAHRVLKPGGHLLAFGGSRTWHRLAVAIEDGGFEIRDSIMWIHGSGFPKSGDISKSIDRAAGAEREVLSEHRTGWNGTLGGKATLGGLGGADDIRRITAPATDDAKRWEGWGTQLKPSFEPIVVARKPMSGTVTANVLEYGTGALNIDGCRIEGTVGIRRSGGFNSGGNSHVYGNSAGVKDVVYNQGRFPANVVFDESQAAALDQQSGNRPSAGDHPSTAESSGMLGHRKQGQLYSDSGGASRFFYVAKAARHERPNVNGVAHPTVKPLSLMRWLVRLVTPPGGTVLDPFAGSGTTLEAAITEGFNPIGIEITDEYLPLIKQRLQKPHQVAFNFPVPEAT